jgi:hypothetical protein
MGDQQDNRRSSVLRGMRPDGCFDLIPRVDLYDCIDTLAAERDALRAVADAAIDWFQWTAFRPLSNRDPLERLHHAVNAYHEGGQ